MQEDRDLLVVGLGPAGAAAAAVAAQGGLRVLGIDRKARLGHPAFPGGGEPRLGWISSRWLGSGKSDGAGTFVNRMDFDRSLVEMAREAGAEIQLETEILELVPATNTARLRSVATGEDREIHFRVLVAADGPHSTVAECLALRPLEVRETRQYALPLARPRRQIQVLFAPGHPDVHAWLLPNGDDRASLAVAHEAGSGSEGQELLDHLHMHLQLLGQVGQRVLRRIGGLMPVGGLRERLVAGSILFAGDAAGLAHPITGMGVHAAVASGEAAANACLAALAGRGQLADYEAAIRQGFGPALAEGASLRERIRGDAARPPACDQGEWQVAAELPL